MLLYDLGGLPLCSVRGMPLLFESNSCKVSEL